MTYECEFVGGHVSKIVECGHAPNFLIGLAHDARGYARTVFIASDGRVDPHHFDPWITAVRPVTPAQACRAYRMPILAEVG